MRSERLRRWNSLRYSPECEHRRASHWAGQLREEKTELPTEISRSDEETREVGKGMEETVEWECLHTFRWVSGAAHMLPGGGLPCQGLGWNGDGPTRWRIATFAPRLNLIYTRTPLSLWHGGCRLQPYLTDQHR